MSTYKYQQGLGSTGAYQVSGRPYITGSVVQGAAGSGAEEVHIKFPSVVKSITFACTGAAGTACRFHFDSIKDSNNVGTAHGPERTLLLYMPQHRCKSYPNNTWKIY